MKETIITLNGKKYTVDYDFKEDYNKVIIYHLKGNTPLPIYIGKDLKSACRKWLNHTEDPSEVFEAWLEWIKENNFTYDYDNIVETGKMFDRYIDEIDALQLFILLAPDDSYTYVDWSEIEEVN